MVAFAVEAGPIVELSCTVVTMIDRNANDVPAGNITCSLVAAEARKIKMGAFVWCAGEATP